MRRYWWLMLVILGMFCIYGFLQNIHAQTMAVLKEIPSDINQLERYRDQCDVMKDSIRSMSWKEFQIAEQRKLNLEYDLARKGAEIINKLGKNQQTGKD